MATITREKIAKTNAKLTNGFTVNIMQALRGEKCFDKDFTTPDGRTAEASIYYLTSRNRDTGVSESYPVVNFNYYTELENGFRRSEGLGWTMKLQNSPVSRKTEKALVEHTKQLDDIACINWMAELQKRYNNPMA